MLCFVMGNVTTDWHINKRTEPLHIMISCPHARGEIRCKSERTRNMNVPPPRSNTEVYTRRGGLCNQTLGAKLEIIYSSEHKTYTTSYCFVHPEFAGNEVCLVRLSMSTTVRNPVETFENSLRRRFPHAITAVATHMSFVFFLLSLSLPMFKPILQLQC